jgi:hypothetical protein
MAILAAGYWIFNHPDRVPATYPESVYSQQLHIIGKKAPLERFTPLFQLR